MNQYKITPGNVWAVTRDGGVAHVVMSAQLATEQAALCGYQPPDGHDWWAAEGTHARPSSSRCRRCAALSAREARQQRGGGE